MQIGMIGVRVMARLMRPAGRLRKGFDAGAPMAKGGARHRSPRPERKERSMTDTPPTDLSIARVIAVPPALVWRCWTEPALVMEWFCPRPWRVAECRIDLRPGGEFYTLMRGPEGEESGGTGVFLDVVPERRLVFTDALAPGWRPSAEPFMTGIVTLEPEGSGTRYTAAALHASEAVAAKHREMGFEAGWNTALDQLVELAATLRA